MAATIDLAHPMQARHMRMAPSLGTILAGAQGHPRVRTRAIGRHRHHPRGDEADRGLLHHAA